MIHVVQVGFHLDRREREPEELLDVWPTLSGGASAVSRNGVRVTVVYPAHRDAIIRHRGVDYRFVAERPAYLRRGTQGSRPVRRPAVRMLDQVAALAPDLVHVHGLGLPTHAESIRKRLPRTRLLAQDHADRPPRPWRRPVDRRAMRSYDAVAFTAREQAEPFLATRMFSPELPVFEVPESSTDFAPGDPALALEEAGIYGEPCLVWLGHLDANKDPLTVLGGLSSATPHLPDPHLWCAFIDAPLLRAVERRVAGDPVLGDRVHLLGPCPHARVERLLRAADALVQGSHREGSGYAIMEAMACGATPVVTDIPPFRRMAGEVGLFWDPGHVPSLRRALLHLGEEDRPLRRERVRKRFERELSWAAVGEKLASIYRALLEEPAPGPGGRP
jgi:glycosyltransferase involved in cell wall biosynthesis